MTCLRVFCVFVFCCFIFRCGSVHAEVIKLSDSIENVYFWDFEHELLIDSNCNISINSIEDGFFEKLWGDSKSIMSRGECRWYKIQVLKVNEKNWFLEMPDAHISTVQLYKRKMDGFYEYPVSGSEYPSKIKSIPHKNHVFELNLTRDEVETFYLKMYSKYPSSGRFHLRSVSYYFGYALDEYYLLGTYYGMLFIMLIYSFLMFLSTRDWLYINYIWYLIGCAVFTLGEDAIGADMLWSNSTWPNDVFFIYGPVIWMIGFILYANSFLKLKTNRFLIFFMGVIMTISILSVSFNFRWHYWLLLFGVGLTLYEAFKKWRSGLKYTRFFLIGYALVFVGLLYYALRVFGLLENTVFNYYVTYYGFVIQSLVFVYAMSDRIKQIRFDKQLAQDRLINQLKVNEELTDKVNRELESKVNTRTEELVLKSEELLRANSKLEELSNELYSMNTVMDKENWRLQKVIKASKEQKVLKDLLSFEEFKEVFPDSISCLKYLADKKWSSGFQCKKCENIKFMKGEKHHSRKCTKCKFDESPTSKTLFQGVRFDLVKAFYICYHTFETKKDCTAREMSEKIDLRKNTCWAFKKKVQEKMNENEVDGWQDLIN